jgi:hypothetical protein
LTYRCGHVSAYILELLQADLLRFVDNPLQCCSIMRPVTPSDNFSRYSTKRLSISTAPFFSGSSARHPAIKRRSSCGLSRSGFPAGVQKIIYQGARKRIHILAVASIALSKPRYQRSLKIPKPAGATSNSAGTRFEAILQNLAAISK